MKNCFVKIYNVEDGLEAGERLEASANRVDSLLYDGPAFLGAPRRGMQEAAALEGLLGANLSVHTRVDLSAAKQVQVSKHSAKNGKWFVVSESVKGDGASWSFALSRRP